MSTEKELMPHVLVFPFPFLGHISPMLKLAELLSGAGIRVTFLNTEYMSKRFLRQSPALSRLERGDCLRLRTVPDGLPEEDPRAPHGFDVIHESLRTAFREPYKELLVSANSQDSDGWPPVSCVVADSVFSFGFLVAEEVGIPTMLYYFGGACSFWFSLHLPELFKQGEVPFPEDADLDEIVHGVPGMLGLLRRRDLQTFCRYSEKSSADVDIFKMMNTFVTISSRAKAVILNTFESLEASVLSRIRSFCPNTYAVGPLHIFVRSSDPPSNLGSSISMRQEDWDCIKWLDSQPRKSVVYVSFGSLVSLSVEELTELWRGLVDSGKRFLWVVRPDMLSGGKLPAEVEEGTRERGCIVGWAPQEEVLAHPAVGCFLTHSGWNSTVESIVAGMPMLCLPFFSDQHPNSRMVSEVWKIGVDMKDKKGRSVVAEMIKETMDEEELRRSATEKSDAARKSVAEGGSSYVDFMKLVQHIKSFSCSK